MRKTRVRLLLAALVVLGVMGVFSCAASERDEKVVFIDLEAVISEEKKRIFSRVLRGELSREEAEQRVGRFFIRFGEVLADYEKKGYLVLDAKSVLGGGRDITGEILEELSVLGEENE
ncbi:MAG: TrbI F-type domain-containing protein [Candidatus Dadabacteria bacterium]|nr:TrbI F-type domain-containing protein [Candidatus Dadabacteria bacterium]MDE0477598.1 TrbI F-type domain-containing protein [Candidatus Dadabacteria bacterium]